MIVNVIVFQPPVLAAVGVAQAMWCQHILVISLDQADQVQHCWMIVVKSLMEVLAPPVHVLYLAPDEALFVIHES